ncbi:F-box domain-containing protein [Caenorhabditis elegans]|uniref:F-box domain-containing protein n=1 Tax=Caenorhabditis elegans TaxID=6239 RepID=Q19588_CAEEL|nr:F-box domain-containing protein [Caenorhabditis elegans]CCD69721.1 F-box domain-containing protein [Caenorhabditis elegans]|eukprot:NP_500594.2 Uncharacterized protein CELE_F19C7.3 [Caenorhabditis elegans]
MKIINALFTYLRIRSEVKPFKILNLPSVVLENVVNQMDIHLVIKLSKTSKKMHSNMKNAKRKIYKLIIDNHHEYNIKNPWPSLVQRILLFETKSDFLFVYRQMCMRKDITSHLAKYTVDFWIEWFYNTTKLDNIHKKSIFNFNNSKKCLTLLTRFDDLFSIDHVDLIINTDKLFGRYRSTIRHPLFRKCDYVELVGRNSFLSNEDMYFVLKNFNLKNGFFTDCKLSNDFNMAAMFKIPRLCIFHAGDITLKHLLSMDCKVIKLWRHQLHPQLINQFIYHWMKGAMPNLRRLRLNLFCDFRRIDEMLNGVKRSKWDNKRRPRIFCDGIERIDCEDGKDILRNDGQLATFFCKNDTVEFLVWHDEKL